MPEDKKTVPIDTSGPDATIDIEEVKDEAVVETEAPEQETQVEEPVKQETEEKKQDENLEDYSKGVQARIAKLTRKMREAERREQANKRIATLAFENAKLDQAKQGREEKPQVETPVNLNQGGNAQPAMDDPINPDPRAEAWASKNSWFGSDKAMTYTAFEIHKDLTEKEGYDPNSDEYYAEVDKRIRVDFPHKFGNTEQKQSTAPVQTVASANRSVKPGRKQVRLTSSQVAIAKKLGVPLEEYAKQLNTKEGA